MFSKRLLSATIAGLVVSSSASAAVVGFNLDGTLTGASTSALKVAKASLVTTDKVTAGGTTYYAITKNDNLLDFDLTGSLGVGLANGQSIYVRVALTNAVFKSSLSSNSLSVVDNGVNQTTSTLSQGGTSGASFAIFSVATSSANNAFESTSQFGLQLQDLAVAGTAPVSASVTIYDSLSNAVNSTNPLSTKNNVGGSVITIGDAITVSTTTETAVADVETLFKKFTNNTTSAKLADLSFPATTGVADATTGAQVSQQGVANLTTSTVVITGDFSVGIWGLDSNANCGDVNTATTQADITGSSLNTAKTALSTTLGGALANPYLCVKIPGTTAVPASTYTVTTTLTAIDNAALGAHTALSTASAGAITRNGTTVQIPYLTTFADYAQRVVIVNRGTADAAYGVTFTTEAGATATAGAQATGTVAAGKTKVIRTVDLVTITGATRTAGTLVVAAPQSKVDVMTTVVSPSSKSTDSVNLNSGYAQ